MSSRELLDHPVIGSRYFFPRRDAVPDPFIVQSDDGVELACHLTAGDPMLLHFHGNGEVVADWLGEFPGHLAGAGIGTLFGEYRGYGGSGGSPAIAAMLDDAVAIARAAPVAPERLVVYGRSVGSIFALHVAATLPVAGLIIESGIADVRERLLLRMRPEELGTTAAELDAALGELVDHQAKIAATTAPVLVFHAAGDDLVPPVHAETLARWAGDRATLRMFERGDHNTIFAYNGDTILAETVEFVRLVTGP